MAPDYDLAIELEIDQILEQRRLDEQEERLTLEARILENGY